MNTVVVLGAGMVAKPMVDYFLDRCGYRVVMATRTVSKAERILAGRAAGEALAWTIEDEDRLDELAEGADLVVSMLPPTMHIPVARACLRHRTPMVTTSYISPAMARLDEEAKAAGIPILNEIGEDPGLDHMGVMKTLDAIADEGGRVLSVTSYGAGLPAFEYNRNPFGYKFSWSPKGVMMAAQTPAVYLRKGRRVEVPGERLFEHHWIVDIEGIGVFETYPNRDSTVYLPWYGLEDGVSLFRGILRFTGWSNTMRALITLGALDDSEVIEWKGRTYADYTTGLIARAGGAEAVGEGEASATAARVREETAEFLGVEKIADVIQRFEWLGLFSDEPVAFERGSRVDVLVDLMLRHMSYAPGERDMIIVHDEISAEFPGAGAANRPPHREIRSTSMVVEGISHGDSAMSRAVSMPAAIAARLILEGVIETTGVLMPTLREIYEPVLAELEGFGLKFTYRRTDI
jgi:saccharopine dehydrogenase-like NADP-dependent oxidoreductase